MSQYLRSSRTIHHRTSDFTLCIFGEDYIRIGKLVSKIPDAETGGNLFGLWTNQGNAVVLVATGPGKNCKRTSASFYQDIPYMQRVGNLVTQEYPLCHIGEWHSHHEMQLYKPSYGDCNTVQRNYPRGSQGFVLMIANILQNGMVKLSPYKFFDERSPHEEGRIEVLAVENPFMKVEQITRAIENGKEEKILQQVTSSKRNHLPSPPSIRRSGGPSKKPKNPLNKEQFKDQSWSTKQGSHIPHPPSRPKKDSRPSPKRACGVSRAKVPSPQTLLPFTTEKLQETNHSYKARQRHPGRYSTTNPQERTQVTAHLWYDTQPDTLRTIFVFVQSLADDQKTVNISRDKTTLSLTMVFTHHYHEWSIEFPFDFPRGSVELRKSGLQGAYSYSIEMLGDIYSFKTKLKSTLEKECSTCALRHQSYPVGSSAVNRRSNRIQTDENTSHYNRKSEWYDTQPETLKTTLDFVTSLADDQKTVNMSRNIATLDMTMEFTHHDFEWSIDFPSEFPRGSVKLIKRLSFPYDTQRVEGRGDIELFKTELEFAFQKKCTKCCIQGSNVRNRNSFR